MREARVFSIMLFLLLLVVGFSTHSFVAWALVEKADIRENNHSPLYSSLVKPTMFSDSISPFFSEALLTIVCDQNLTDYGFPGAGTVTDPYRIENLSLTGTTYELLFISNTTKHILIRNCTFYARYFAIVLGPLAPGTVVIDSCIIQTQDYVGIFCSTDNVTISNCLFQWNYDGINYNDCLFVQIVNNTFLNNHQGVRIEQNASRSVIADNYFYQNTIGIRFENAPYNTICGNVFLSNFIGILLTSTSPSPSSSFCVITDNRIENSSSYGMIITAFSEQDFSQENLIFGNSFANNNNSAASQAKDDGAGNRWYNKTARQGNYWADWWGIGGYELDGLAKSFDLYPSGTPFHSLQTPVPRFLKGRAILFSAVAFIVLISFILSLLIKNATVKEV